ncbi:MAG: hypothetical protein K6G80_05430 [Treponema sp.]|nr:hypothetical protein [Treponema sp.]
MKKPFLPGTWCARALYAGLCTFSFFATACQLYTERSESQSQSSSPQAALTAPEETLSLSGVRGKQLFAIITNPAPTEADEPRTVSATTGIEPASPITKSALASRNALCSKPAGTESPEPTFGGCYIPPRHWRTDTAPADSRNAADSISAPGKLSSPVVDSTTMLLWVDADPGMSIYAKKQATLRASGTYCYVWVVDEYYTTDEVSAEHAAAKVNSAICQTLAERFDALYPVERTLFGNESESIRYNSDGSDRPYAALSDWSATGSTVNIVLYDIGKDYNFPLARGVMGYFYSKDYYIPVKNGDLRYSNQGKYFYVDSYYAVKYPEMTVSTLAHEFQHMINFGVDKSAGGEEAEIWYQELLALLAEDAMSDFLELPETAGPRNRLSSFNAHYALSGIEYNNAQGSLSYATLYAFGAWCARNFGGAAFIRELAQNNTANYTSVVQAVNTLTGGSYTMESLLALYASSLVDPEAAFSANKTAEESIVYEAGPVRYTYPLSAIDLWSKACSWTTSVYSENELLNTRNKDGTYSAPALFNPKAITPALRPYGCTLYKLGTAAEDDISVTFSSGSAQTRVYIVATD